MAFLNGREGCCRTDDDRSVLQRNRGNRQRQQKQQRTCRFVHNRMNSHKPLLYDKSGNDINDLYESDDSDPYITLSQFFAETDMVELTPELKSLFDGWVSLTPEQKSAVQNMIDVLNSQ